jgi:dsDNA-binding SOS-regulon protein
MRHKFTKNKFNAKPTEIDGIRFDSKKEAARYSQLKMLRSAGEVVMFLLQVPFILPGNTRYRVDFAVFWADGRVTFEDTKGRETETFKLKKRQVEALYPVTIEMM